MCDTLVVVRDNEVFFAKNSDRDPNEAQVPTWVPARDHERGAMLRCTWTVIPEVRRTHAVLLSRPYWMWGAEIGANEHGVVAGNEAVFARTKRVDGDGLLGMDLLRLALERGRTAQEAVEVIRALLAAHGQGGRAGYDDPGFRYHSSFIVADARTAFVVETVGRDIEVQRVAQGARSISNGLTIGAFADRHADRLRDKMAASGLRRGITEELGAEATQVRDFANILRNHGEGSELPRYDRIRGAMTGPCVHAGGALVASQTTASWISRITADGAAHFLTGTAAPCLSVFRPVTLQRPLAFGAPTGIYDGEALFWRFERLHRRMLRDAELARRWQPLQKELQEKVWSGMLDAEAAHAAFDALVAGSLATVASEPPPPDRRASWLRRYWQARERDAEASAPKLPWFPP